MTIRIDTKPFLVFDLDDTLYSELSFLISGYQLIAKKLEKYSSQNIFESMYAVYNSGGNVFQWVVEKYGVLNPEEINIPNLLHIYRTHLPDIKLYDDVKEFLASVKMKGLRTGLITDGRSITQRNKLKALGLSDYFDEVIISEEFGSEKPAERNYAHFENKFPGYGFHYFGDNVKKDFISPINRGWSCYCLEDRGQNIHNQPLVNLTSEIIILKNFSQILVS